jgi:SpoVK/Ycf46/Vps4 family AAA+-type ATPase
MRPDGLYTFLKSSFKDEGCEVRVSDRFDTPARLSDPRTGGGRGLFVAATANRIDLLPAEMIRKGRFDEVFFVDLPHDSERIEIFKIHLSRRGVNVAGFDLGKLTQFTTGWAGAEIEQCVVSAMTKARLAGREVSEEDLIRVAVKIVPLSRTMNEQINHIRGWAFERAVRASHGPASR